MVGLEQCDDGSDDSLGCNHDCSGDFQGYSCTHTIGGTSSCNAICGDSFRVPPELCDDGTNLDGEGCLPDCSASLSKYSCSGGSLSSNDICIPVCGDGFVLNPEACDDGVR